MHTPLLGQARWRTIPLPEPLWLWITADVLDDDCPGCTVHAVEVHRNGEVYAVATLEGFPIEEPELLRRLGREALRVSGLSPQVSQQSRAGRPRPPFDRRR